MLLETVNFTNHWKESNKSQFILKRFHENVLPAIPTTTTLRPKSNRENKSNKKVEFSIDPAAATTAQKMQRKARRKAIVSTKKRKIDIQLPYKLKSYEKRFLRCTSFRKADNAWFSYLQSSNYIPTGVKKAESLSQLTEDTYYLILFKEQ